MTLTHEIEIVNAKVELDYLEVEFEAYPRWENNSYDDEYGTVKMSSYASLEHYGSPTWDKSKHTPEENKLIEAYALSNEFSDLEDRFCEQFQSE